MVLASKAKCYMKLLGKIALLKIQDLHVHPLVGRACIRKKMLDMILKIYASIDAQLQSLRVGYKTVKPIVV